MQRNSKSTQEPPVNSLSWRHPNTEAQQLAKAAAFVIRGFRIDYQKKKKDFVY